MKKYILAAALIVGCADEPRIRTLEEALAEPSLKPAVYSGELREVIEVGKDRETMVQVGRRWYIVHAYPREVREVQYRKAIAETTPGMIRVMVGDTGWMVVKDLGE